MLTWENIIKEWSQCRKCELGEKALAHLLGQGEIPCDIMLLGESVRKQDESDANSAQQSFLEEFTRYALPERLKKTKLRIFSTTLLACRPTDTKYGPNRFPSESEIIACSPRMEQTLLLCQPKVTICYGQGAQTEIRRLLRRITLDTLILDLPHPQNMLRRGGTDAPDYPEFQEKLSFAIEKHLLPLLQLKDPDKIPTYSVVEILPETRGEEKTITMLVENGGKMVGKINLTMQDITNLSNVSSVFLEPIQ